MERERKIDIVLLVWTLILGFPKGTRRTLASLRRQLVQVSGTSIARSSFYDRLSPALADLMEQLVDWLLDFRTENTAGEISEKFEGFQELLAVDSTVFQLHEMLVDNFESTNPGEAAGKLHVVANVIDGKTNSVQLTGQTTPDNRPWKTIGSWVENSLLTLDLGYYDFHLFHCIDQQDGFFYQSRQNQRQPADCPVEHDLSGQLHRPRRKECLGGGRPSSTPGHRRNRRGRRRTPEVSRPL